MARRLPPHVQAALVKRRGTAATRRLAMEAQAPHGPPVVITQEKLQKARDLVLERGRQGHFDFSKRATQRTTED